MERSAEERERGKEGWERKAVESKEEWRSGVGEGVGA